MREAVGRTRCQLVMFYIVEVFVLAIFVIIFCLQVLLRLRQERRNDEKPTRREKNRTWGQATLQKGRERGAIKDLDYGHNYENVYDDDDDEGIERGRRHSEKGRAALYRSKSCDRAGVRGAVRDQVSGYRQLLEIVKVLTVISPTNCSGAKSV